MRLGPAASWFGFCFHELPFRPCCLTWQPLAEQAEREERELRRAEMEAQKAENMVAHAAEIAARPAKTWFQSGREKAAAAERCLPLLR